VPDIGIGFSLAVILVTLSITAVLSALGSRRQTRKAAADADKA
jgi:hypothetical protein